MDRSNDKPPQDPEHRELWRFAQKLLFVAALVLLVWLWVAFTQVWMLVIAASLFAILLNRASCAICKRTKISRRWALALISLVLLVLIAGIFWIAVPNIAEQARQLAEAVPQSFEQLQKQVRDYTWGKKALAAANQAEAYLPDQAAVYKRLTGIFSSVIGIFGSFLFILFIGYCLAIEPGIYTSGILHLVPKHRRDNAKNVMVKLEHTLATWIMARFASMVLVGILTWIALSVLGIPLSFILALLAGAFDFIPNVGPFLAAAPAVLLALLISPSKALTVALAYWAIQTVEAYIFTPIIERKTVKLPPAITAVVQILLGLSVGILGVALGAPITLTAILLMKELYVRDYLHDKSVGTP